MTIDKMTLPQLKSMLAKVEAEIPKAEARAKAEVRAEIDKMLAGTGLKIDDVLGSAGNSRRSTKGRSVPAKYQDPKTGATWAGRGRSPKWYDKRHPERFQVGEPA